MQNRNWNIARKRTAEGRFADDQTADDAGAEAPINQDHDSNGHQPRKRMHRDVSNYRSEHPTGMTTQAAHAYWAQEYSDGVPLREQDLISFSNFFEWLQMTTIQSARG